MIESPDRLTSTRQVDAGGLARAASSCDRARARPSGRSPGSGRSARRRAGRRRARSARPSSPSMRISSSRAVDARRRRGAGSAARRGRSRRSSSASRMRSDQRMRARTRAGLQVAAAGRRTGGRGRAPWRRTSPCRPRRAASPASARLVRLERAQAGRGGHAHDALADRHAARRADRVEQLAGDRARRRRRSVRREDDAELVAAEPADASVARTRAAGAPARTARSMLVADRVAVGVVDVLEVVDVERDDGGRRRRGGGRAASARSSSSSKRAAVEQAGERVVAGEVLELGLRSAAAR